jgi:hypothetical protein
MPMWLTHALKAAETRAPISMPLRSERWNVVRPNTPLDYRWNSSPMFTVSKYFQPRGSVVGTALVLGSRRYPLFDVLSHRAWLSEVR